MKIPDRITDLKDIETNIKSMINERKPILEEMETLSKTKKIPHYIGPDLKAYFKEETESLTEQLAKKDASINYLDKFLGGSISNLTDETFTAVENSTRFGSKESTNIIYRKIALQNELRSEIKDHITGFMKDLRLKNKIGLIGKSHKAAKKNLRKTNNR